MNDKTIFTFWEPKDRIIPYIRLCIKTWELNIADYDVIILDYSNLGSYIEENIFDLSTLKKLSLPAQKDAIMVHILNKFGGIFMDADTIVTKDISPVVCKLKNTEAVMFNTHVAFLAARPNARLLSLWQNGIQGRLSKLKGDQKGEINPGWDYVGNSVLSEIMSDMVSDSHFGCIYEHIDQYQASWAHWPKIFWHLIADPFWARRREFFFLTVYKKYLTMLDRKKYGFIAEEIYFGKMKLRPEGKYKRFWFGDNLEVKNVFQKNQMLIGLHNSWTPSWYKTLSEEQVLKNKCLLSKTLRHILAV
jgi:hypothetical protein